MNIHSAVGVWACVIHTHTHACVHTGDEEDHDDDSGGRERAGGPFLPAGLPKVCAGCHPHYRV